MQEILFCMPPSKEEERKISAWLKENFADNAGWNGHIAIYVPTKQVVIAFKLTFGSNIIFDIVDWNDGNIRYDSILF